MGWRYRLDLEYDGAEFSGWQRQPDRRTVQGEVERLLAKLNEAARPVGSGRTDAGVHALQNTAHVDLGREWPEEELLHALSSLAPPDLAVRSVGRVPGGFHARFDATARTYQYALGARPDPFFRSRRWVPRTLPEPGRVREELVSVLGEGDFASLARSGSETRTTRCRVEAAAWDPTPSGALVTVTADRFLYGMVRALVGSVVRGCGRGERPGFLGRVLARRDRGAAGEAAPPQGLYLASVRYAGETPPDRSEEVVRLAGIGGTHR